MERTLVKTLKTATCITAILALTACGDMISRMKAIGQEPTLAKIESPFKDPEYKPVSLPMPTQVVAQKNPSSLWDAQRQKFFKDQRANKIGDILTVLIAIDDEADFDNKTERTRSGTEAAGITNLLGIAESQLTKKLLPEGADNASLADINSASTSSGDGTIERGEKVNLKLAAMITQVLPNGNFVIQGHQQVRVNFELRDLQLNGVIRPEDIKSDNSITHDKIAEARIAYGGQGNISELQQPRYGQQVFDVLYPF